MNEFCSCVKYLDIVVSGIEVSNQRVQPFRALIIVSLEWFIAACRACCQRKNVGGPRLLAVCGKERKRARGKTRKFAEVKS